jgi:hypothetical protein
LARAARDRAFLDHFDCISTCWIGNAEDQINAVFKRIKK